MIKIEPKTQDLLDALARAEAAEARCKRLEEMGIRDAATIGEYHSEVVQLQTDLAAALGMLRRYAAGHDHSAKFTCDHNCPRNELRSEVRRYLASSDAAAERILAVSRAAPWMYHWIMNALQSNIGPRMQELEPSESGSLGEVQRALAALEAGRETG